MGFSEDMPEWTSLMNLERTHFDGRWMKISGAHRIQGEKNGK